MNIPSNFFDNQSPHSWTTDEQKKDNTSESNQLQIEGIEKDQQEEIHKFSYKPKSTYQLGQDKRGNLCDEEHLKDLGNSLVSIIQEQTKSVACMIFSEKLEKLQSGNYQLLDMTTLAKRIESEIQHKIMYGPKVIGIDSSSESENMHVPFGEKEAFRDEPAPGFGTAFFIGGKFALTAGHCVCLGVQDRYACKENEECINECLAKTKLVFNFKMEEKNRCKEIFDESDVYEIKRVVSHKYTKIKDEDQCDIKWVDWAIIELKEEVKGREPLRVDYFKRITKNINLYMLGHPSGLSMKLTKDGRVKNDKHPEYFTCDLDAFSGNSGSPVFNREKPHEVVGILCGGGEDYEVTNNYKGNREKRIQTHHVTDGFEKCQRVSSLLIELERCGALKEQMQSPQKKERINQFLVSLKNNYNRKKETLQLIRKTPNIPIDVIYTQLVLIEKNSKKSDNEEKKENEKQNESKNEEQLYQEGEINGWESIQGSKTIIGLNKLFEKPEGQEKAPKNLLILGQAGIGKSTLCHHIARQWAKGKLWNDKFDALFWVPLRQLQNSDSQETALSFLFRHCCQGTHELYPSEIENYIEKNNDQILFVLDGYDEVDLLNETQKKIVDEFQKNSHWIITSRPFAAQDLKADAIIENVGFNSETIEIYIRKLFPHENDKKSAELAVQAIRQNPIIFSLCRIPINLELISAIIEKKIEENKKLEIKEKNTLNISSIQSMSDLYQELTRTLQKRFLEKAGIINSSRIGDDELQEILDFKKLSPIFEFLESAAYIAIQNKELLFSFNKGSLNELYLQYSEQERKEFRKRIRQTGFIQSTTSNFYTGQHSFLHLTFQEFFAARHFVRLLKNQEMRSDAERAIEEIKFNPRYKIMIWFVAGLLKDDPKNLNTFFDLLDEPKDAIGLYSSMLKLRCLEECGWSDKLEKIKEYEEEIQWWCNLMTQKIIWKQVGKFVTEVFEISPQGSKRLLFPIKERYVINDDKPLPELSAFPLIEKACTNKNFIERSEAIEIVGKLAKSNPEWAFPLIEKAFDDNVRFVADTAVRAFEKLTQGNLELVIPLIERAFHVKNSCIRNAVFKAMNKLAQSKPKLAILLIERAFDSDFRKDAVYILIKLAQNNPKWAMPLIERAVDDNDSLVRLHAINAVRKLTQSSPEWAFPLLVARAFGDNNSDVVDAATYAMRELVQSNREWNIPLMNRAFERVFDVKNSDDVRASAIYAVMNLAKSNPKWAIPLIERAFDENNCKFKIIALLTLRKIAQSNPNWATSLIERAFDDNNSDVIGAAVFAVGKLAQINLEWAFPVIERVLKKENSMFRIHALITLGKLAENNPKWALPLIERAMKNENIEFRAAAIGTLLEVAQSNPKWAFPLIKQAIESGIGAIIVINGLVKLIQSQPKWTLSVIKRAFEHEEYEVRNLAISEIEYRLDQINMEWVFPLIERALDSKYSDVRKGAVNVMGKLAPKIDWSRSFKLVHIFCLCLFKWTELEEKSHLSSTPLSSLIKNYIKEEKSIYHPDYLLVIAIKCLEQNIGIFLKDNNTLCFYEQGEMHQIENVPNAAQWIIDIQQTIKDLGK